MRFAGVFGRCRRRGRREVILRDLLLLSLVCGIRQMRFRFGHARPDGIRQLIDAALGQSLQRALIPLLLKIPRRRQIVGAQDDLLGLAVGVAIRLAISLTISVAISLRPLGRAGLWLRLPLRLRLDRFELRGARLGGRRRCHGRHRSDGNGRRRRSSSGRRCSLLLSTARPRQCMNPGYGRSRLRNAAPARDRLPHARQLIQTRLDRIEHGVVGSDRAVVDLHDERFQLMTQVSHGRDAGHAGASLEGMQRPLESGTVFRARRLRAPIRHRALGRVDQLERLFREDRGDLRIEIA